MTSPEATNDNKQDGKKFGRKNNQRSGTELSQTRPRFPVSIAVVKDNFAKNKLISLIIHLLSRLIYSVINLRKRLNLFKRYNYVDTDNIFAKQNIKLKMLHCSITKICAWHSAQWNVVLCLNGYVEQNQIHPCALGSTMSLFLGQPWSSMFSTRLIKQIDKSLAFFSTFSQVFTIYISGRNVGKRSL